MGGAKKENLNLQLDRLQAKFIITYYPFLDLAGQQVERHLQMLYKFLKNLPSLLCPKWFAVYISRSPLHNIHTCGGPEGDKFHSIIIIISRV